VPTPRAESDARRDAERRPVEAPLCSVCVCDYFWLCSIAQKYAMEAAARRERRRVSRAGVSRTTLTATARELATHDFLDLPRDGEWLFDLSVLAEIAVCLGDLRRGRMLYDQLLPYAHMNAAFTGEIALGSVSRYLGMLARMLGCSDDRTTRRSTSNTVSK
jgi:hypothetical protein